jgi:putative endonuclease
MKTIGRHNYYVYILTNFEKTVLYTGVTNSIEKRIQEHRADSTGAKNTFAGKYNCVHVVYLEHHRYINNAIAREKEIKGWRREKKEVLIRTENPEWKFLEEEWELNNEG